jgi:chromosome segregation ATPase
MSMSGKDELIFKWWDEEVGEDGSVYRRRTDDLIDAVGYAFSTDFNHIRHVYLDGKHYVEEYPSEKSKSKEDDMEYREEKTMRKLLLKKVVRLKSQRALLQEDKGRLYKEASEARTDISNLKTQITNLRGAVQKLDEERKRLQLHIDEMGRVDVAKDMEIGQMRAQIESQKEHIEGLAIQLHDFSKQLSDSRAAREDLETTISNLREINTRYADAIAERDAALSHRSHKILKYDELFNQIGGFVEDPNLSAPLTVKYIANAIRATKEDNQ